MPVTLCIPVLLFLLYIFVCFDPSICYSFPCLFVSSIYYLAFLSCSILFLHHIYYLLFCYFFILYQCIMIRFSYFKLVLIGLEKRAHRPTRQAQRSGAPHAIPKPLWGHRKMRAWPTKSQRPTLDNWEAHVLQVRFNSANTENRINNILSSQSNQISKKNNNRSSSVGFPPSPPPPPPQ